MNNNGRSISSSALRFPWTDATSEARWQDGLVTGFINLEQCTLEGMGIDAASRAVLFEALESIRPGRRRQFDTIRSGRRGRRAAWHDLGNLHLSMNDNF